MPPACSAAVLSVMAARGAAGAEDADPHRAVPQSTTQRRIANRREQAEFIRAALPDELREVLCTVG